MLGVGLIPGVNSGQMGGIHVVVGQWQTRAWYYIISKDISICCAKTRQVGVRKRNKGNILADMVDVQDLVGRTRRQAMFT